MIRNSYRNLGRVLMTLGVLCFSGFALAQESDPSAESAPEKMAPAAIVSLSFGLELDRETRSLVASSDRFPAEQFSATEGSVICLSRVMNVSPPAQITHVWYHEGKTMARVDLKVGSADWRTWSSKRILPSWTGQWEVKVLDDTGMVLATESFVVE